MGIRKHTPHADHGNIIIDLTIGSGQNLKCVEPGNHRILLQEQFLMNPGDSGLVFKKKKAFAGHEIAV